MDTTGRVAQAERLVGSDRVLAVLKELARYPEGIGLDELSRVVGSPKPTVHRALVALRRAGLADQDMRGHYVLGDEFLRLAFIHHEARPDHVRILPVLNELATRFGETAHYAVLDNHSIVYRSKVDPPSGAIRLSSTVGGRNPAHTTAVGKLLLAYRLTTPEEVDAWVGTTTLERRTPKSKCTASDLLVDLEEIRAKGYGTDDQENEDGVTCIAVPVFLGTTSDPSGAVSVSALAFRTSLRTLVDAVPRIRDIVDGQRSA